MPQPKIDLGVVYELRQYDDMDPVGSVGSKFIMTAPLLVIRSVLSLHADALLRIMNTCQPEGVHCVLHRSATTPLFGGAWHFSITRKGS